MNRLIIWKMLLEEIRLNTSFASGKGFYSFPILVIISGILAIVFADEMIADMGYKDFLESCHIAILFYGIFTGFLAFFGSDFLARIFGYLGLIIGLPSTQPLSQKRITLLYFIKEIIFYSIFTLLPALLGAVIGSQFNNFNLMNVILFSTSLFLTFIMGLAFAYLISSLYRISLKHSIIGSSFALTCYIFVIQDSDITPSLHWYLNSNINSFLISITITGILTTAATLLINEINEVSSIPQVGYRERFKEYKEKFNWAKNITSTTIISKERIDLQRSKTGIKMFFSFAFPLLTVFSS